MHDDQHSTPPELVPIIESLRRIQPSPPRLVRDRLMFTAGAEAASAMASRSASGRSLGVRLVSAWAGISTIAAAILTAILLTQSPTGNGFGNQVAEHPSDSGSKPRVADAGNTEDLVLVFPPPSEPVARTEVAMNSAFALRRSLLEQSTRPRTTEFAVFTSSSIASAGVPTIRDSYRQWGLIRGAAANSRVAPRGDQL